MSYNLDALTDDPGLNEDTVRSSKRARKKDSSDPPEPVHAPDSDKPNHHQSGVISYLSLARHIVFLSLFLAGAISGFLYRREVMGSVGYGALPIGLWWMMFVYLAITRTAWLVRRYRETLSSLILVLGAVTVLGIFDAPLGSETGATMGGRVGEILAREPFNWDRYNLVLWHQILAWVRASLFFTAGAATQFPTAFGIGMRVLWIGVLMAVSASVGLFVMAGGAAASIAINRKRKVESASSETDAALGGAVHAPAVAELSNLAAADASQMDLDDDHSEFVVGMGNTIYVDDDDAQELWDDEDDIMEAQSLDGFGDASHREAFAEETSEFIEVGEAIASVADVDAENPTDILGNNLDSEPSEDARASNVAVPEDERHADESVSNETEEVFRLITSGAALEAAMNAFPWHLPPVEHLTNPPKGGVATAEIRATSDLIEDTLEEHGIAVTVDQVRVGPTVTMYGLKPGWKGGGSRSNAPRQRVRVDTILNREKDIALALSSPNIRFESVVPGSSVVGIEVPNARPTPVNLRTVMDSSEWSEFVEDAALPVPMGIGSGGDPVMADFSKMPHTLVAGATGSGKSVCMNTIVTGLLMSRTPLELRMVMIDPKRVELTPYQGIPHLYTPVIVEPEKAVKALKALVKEMMDRFSTLEAAGVKNIISYNAKSTSKMPYLLILVDELADLMLTSSNEVEQLLVRLAQLGRATGLHLVVATQRPSVDVVTGLIKANFPSRISFAVGSQVDSRTILDSTGADKLLGKGDMLYKPIDLSQPVRVQGAFLSEEEIETIVEFWKDVGAPPMPQLDVDGEGDDEEFSIPGLPSEDNGDALFMQASTMAKSQKTLSTSLLQRRLRIGYPRAARLMDELEEAGIVGPGEPGKPRQVIANI